MRSAEAGGFPFPGKVVERRRKSFPGLEAAACCSCPGHEVDKKLPPGVLFLEMVWIKAEPRFRETKWKRDTPPPHTSGKCGGCVPRAIPEDELTVLAISNPGCRLDMRCGVSGPSRKGSRAEPSLSPSPPVDSKRARDARPPRIQEAEWMRAGSLSQG